LGETEPGEKRKCVHEPEKRKCGTFFFEKGKRIVLGNQEKKKVGEHFVRELGRRGKKRRGGRKETGN